MVIAVKWAAADGAVTAAVIMVKTAIAAHQIAEAAVAQNHGAAIAQAIMAAPITGIPIHVAARILVVTVIAETVVKIAIPAHQIAEAAVVQSHGAVIAQAITVPVIAGIPIHAIANNAQSHGAVIAQAATAAAIAGIPIHAVA